MRIDPKTALHLAIWVYSGLHLLLAGALPLAAHEAHYGLYARDLQASYVDHPPLVAWLQALVLLFSSTDFAMRLLPIGLSVGAQYLLAQLARAVYPTASPWLPVLCVLILQGTLIFHGSMTLSPDVPLAPLGMLVVLMTISSLERDRWADWLLLGVLLGLAGLAKYTAVMLAISVVLGMLLQRGWRCLFSLRLWLSGAAALLVVSPVLWWNWQNDWVTVAFHADYQFEDIERWSALNFLRSMGEQVLYYSPLLVVGGIATLWQLWRTLRWPAARTQSDVLLAVFVAPVLVVYLLTALESRASPHWSMLGWILLIPLLGRWLLEQWPRSKPVRLLGWTSGSYSAAVLLALLMVAVPIGTWPEFKHPSRLVVGWEAAARHGDALRATLQARSFESEPVILARNWHHAGLLAWYAPDAGVKNLFDDLNPYNQRLGLSDHTTWGVLVYPRDSHQPRLDNLTRDFDCEPIDALPAYFGSSLVQVFHYYACYSKLPAPAGTSTGRQS